MTQQNKWEEDYASVLKECDLQPDSETGRFAKMVVQGFHGMDQRIHQIMNALMRSAGSANMGWNLSNVIVRALGDRLIERGIFTDNEDLQKAMMEASNRLTEEAKQQGSEADPVAKHIGDLIKKNADTISKNLYGE